MRGDPLTTDSRALSNELFDFRGLTVIFVVGICPSTVHAHFAKTCALPHEIIHSSLQRFNALVQLLQVVAIRWRHVLEYTVEESCGSTRTCHKNRALSSGVGIMHTSRRPNQR
jgi:hypothetical protein